MNGFTLIAKLSELNYTLISKQMNLSPQYIQQWAKGIKDIPEKRQKELADILNIDKKYLNSNISENDQLKLLEILISKRIEKEVKITFK
jgi:transcriptional regulator with XRE-family HTH domain